MRVLVVAPYPPRRCGIGAYARDQVEDLRSEGHDVTVLSPPDGAGENRAPFLGGGAFVRAARIGGRFDRIAVHFQPALYYRPRAPVSKIWTSLALLLLTLRRRQLELIVHEADPPVRRRPDYLILGLAFRSCRRVSFHTEAEWRALERDYGVRVRGRVVPHALSPSVRPSREDARRALGLPARERIFVCPGFLQSSKGFDRAVDAFAAMDGVGPARLPTGDGEGASLYVVGSVRERTPENETYARELRERCARVRGVTFVEEYVEDEQFDRWVAAADRVVLPYRRSWSSGVLARAQALGTPAIVADVGGLAEQAGERDVVFNDDGGLAWAMREAAGRGHDEPPITRHRPHESEWDPFYEPPTAPEERGKGRRMLLLLILVSVLLAALAQLTLKHGMNQVSREGAIPLSLSRPGETVRRVASNVSVWIGLGMFGLSAAIWIIVLSRTSLSFAYPFASLTYVLILLFDRLVLKDQVPLMRWSGVALIVSGILLVSRTPHT
ncbi:MAG: glycosyltransferase [Actinobacteria bacterium]|nr:glycosyltransferase [Actinomycetota bacterium]